MYPRSSNSTNYLFVKKQLPNSLLNIDTVIINKFNLAYFIATINLDQYKITSVEKIWICYVWELVIVYDDGHKLLYQRYRKINVTKCPRTHSIVPFPLKTFFLFRLFTSVPDEIWSQLLILALGNWKVLKEIMEYR